MSYTYRNYIFTIVSALVLIASLTPPYSVYANEGTMGNWLSARPTSTQLADGAALRHVMHAAAFLSRAGEAGAER